MRTVSRRLRELRVALELSQEAIGAQGFVSTSGWAKIENGQRQPGDILLQKFVSWLEKDHYVGLSDSLVLLDELKSLKYMDHPSLFVRDLATEHHAGIKPHTRLSDNSEKGMRITTLKPKESPKKKKSLKRMVP